MTHVVANLAADAPSAFPDGPVVVIRWRAPSAVERQEIFSGPVTPDGGAGVEAEHVVKALCRTLDTGPGSLAFEADEKARHLRGDNARCYLTDAAGQRIAHIIGISFAWLEVDAARLATAGWRPGLNREPAAPPRLHLTGNLP